MKKVKVTINRNRVNELVLDGLSNMETDKDSQIEVIVYKDLLIKTTIDNIKLIQKGIKLEEETNTSEELSYIISGELDGSVGIQFDDYEFNGTITHITQKELDTEGYSCRDIVAGI